MQKHQNIKKYQTPTTLKYPYIEAKKPQGNVPFVAFFVEINQLHPPNSVLKTVPLSDLKPALSVILFPAR